jgi:CBS domain-containing protein
VFDGTQAARAGEEENAMPKHLGSTGKAADAHPASWVQRRARSARSEAERTPVSAIMRSDVATVMPDTSLETVTELILESGASSLPVVDPSGKVVGIVSKTDVLADRQLRGDTSEIDPPRGPMFGAAPYPEAGIHVHEMDGAVADVMRRSVLVLSETASLKDACALMAVNHVHGIPIVAADGRVIGVVTSLDVLGWMAGLT